jgi:hypothetical protein
LEIYGLKTSPAFEAAVALGVRLAGATPAKAAALDRYALHVGTGFQVLNDLKDWAGDLENDRRAAGDLIALIGGNHGFRRDPGEVIGNHMTEFLEPVIRHLGEYRALARNRLGQNNIEGRQAVGLHHQQFVVADGVEIAHLAAMQEGQAFQAGFKNCFVGHGVVPCKRLNS